jgi:hypothetical protein
LHPKSSADTHATDLGAATTPSISTSMSAASDPSSSASFSAPAAVSVPATTTADGLGSAGVTSAAHANRDAKATDPAQTMRAGFAVAPLAPTSSARSAIDGTLERLGIHQAGLADGGSAAAIAKACFTVPAFDAAAEPSDVTLPVPAQRNAASKRRQAEAPAAIRGPPAPVNPPTSPVSAGAAAGAPASGTGGTTFFAVLVTAVTAPLAATAIALPDDCNEHAGTQTSSDSARAPPAV